MEQIIIGIVIGISIPIFFYLGICKTRINKKRVLDNECLNLEQRIITLNSNIEELDKECWQLSDEISHKKIENNNLQVEIVKLETKKETIIQSLAEMDRQAQITTQAIYDKNYEKMSQRLDQSAAALGAEYQELEKQYNDEYLQLLAELAAGVGEELKEQKESLLVVQNAFKEWSQKVSAAVANEKRAAQEIEQRDFYRVNVSDEDIQEIKKLREIIPFLRDQEALNKVIWKVYYEKPTTDLIGRTIGNERKTGIYKITDLENKKCYVGQAVDVAARWRQHIKRGLGAETPTRNKLYPAMQQKGVENFTFELIEECDASLLDSREDFWQEQFHARDFGYSIK